VIFVVLMVILSASQAVEIAAGRTVFLIKLQRQPSKSNLFSDLLVIR